MLGRAFHSLEPPLWFLPKHERLYYGAFVDVDVIVVVTQQLVDEYQTFAFLSLAFRNVQLQPFHLLQTHVLESRYERPLDINRVECVLEVNQSLVRVHPVVPTLSQSDAGRGVVGEQLAGVLVLPQRSNHGRGREQHLRAYTDGEHFLHLSRARACARYVLGDRVRASRAHALCCARVRVRCVWWAVVLCCARVRVRCVRRAHALCCACVRVRCVRAWACALTLRLDDNRLHGTRCRSLILQCE